MKSDFRPAEDNFSYELSVFLGLLAVLRVRMHRPQQLFLERAYPGASVVFSCAK
jgi:hypothetical protein